MKNRTPMIWNITNKCLYSCSFCCLGANSSREDISLEDKLKIVKNLDSDTIEIDVSGGDPLIDLENLKILKSLSKKFGRENISITSTGKGLEKVGLTELGNYISEVGFTYDFPREPSPNRPLGYNEYNLKLAREVSKKGIETMAQIPLMRSNIDSTIIKEIFLNLNEAEISKILLMRFSESGRGISKANLSLSQNEINNALKIYKNLEFNHKHPKIESAPSVKGILIGRALTSLNITNQGLLLSNPWSYNLEGKPEKYCILGDLTKNKLSELAGANIYQRFFTQLRRNILK
ncbi:radical SAM protein [Candidatus Pacearchaeota archaeon]|nr:radical SAM protein [Candidatus Pacearchaeota archaeon]